MITRICPICGKSFQTTKNTKYCSIECAAVGSRKKRQEYLKAHPELKDRQREYNRKRRQELREAEDRASREKQLRDYDEIDVSGHVEQLEREAEAGSLIARYLLAKRKGNRNEEFWSAFRDLEMSLDDDSITLVNQIPVIDDLFVEKVLQSIDSSSGIIIER